MPIPLSEAVHPSQSLLAPSALTPFTHRLGVSHSQGGTGQRDQRTDRLGKAPRALPGLQAHAPAAGAHALTCSRTVLFLTLALLNALVSERICVHMCV